MPYIIYNTINEIDFKNFHKRIKKLQKPFIDFLAKYNFNLTNESELADILGLDFISVGTKFDGNIGFQFDDDTTANTFTFYIAKSLDKGNIRYSKRVNILERSDLTEIEKDYVSLLEKAVDVYINMAEEHLTDKRKLKNI